MKKYAVFAVLASVMLAVLLPKPELGMKFSPGTEVSVTRADTDGGHLRFRVIPKEVAGNFRSITLCGLPIFFSEWMRELGIAPSEPLGETEIVDYPNFFKALGFLPVVAKTILVLFPIAMFVWLLIARWLYSLRSSEHIFWICACVLTALSLPRLVISAQPGLDTSWQWFLSYAKGRYVFGRDFVFTYGPLGFLLYPHSDFWSVALTFFSTIVFCSLWLYLLFKVYHSQFENSHASSWLLLLTIIFPQSTLEWRWAMLAVSYLIFPLVLRLNGRDCEKRFFVMGGCMFAFVTFVKFSSLVAVGVTHFMVWVILMLMAPRRSVRNLSVYLSSFLLMVVCWSILCFDGFSSVLKWIAGSMQTASGYNLNMVALKTPWELCLPVVVGAIVAFVITRGRLRHIGAWLQVAACAPILFCCAKYAWVRQSSCAMLYASVVLLALNALPSVQIGFRTLFVGVPFCLLANGIALVSFSSWLCGANPLDCLGVQPRSILQMLSLPRAMRQCDDRSYAALKNYVLPTEWLQTIGSHDVMMIPFDYGYAMRYPTLNLVPYYSLQMYSGCHPLLDEENARKILRTRPYIICGINCFWSGNFLNYPRVWQVIMEEFRCADVRNGFALLIPEKDRTRDLIIEDTAALNYDSLQIRMNQWLAIPTDSVLCVGFRRTLYGRVRASIYRNAIVNCHVRYDDGVETRFQFLPDMVNNVGFRFDWIPSDDSDVIRLLRRETRHRPLAIKFSAFDNQCYEEIVSVGISRDEDRD